MVLAAVRQNGKEREGGGGCIMHLNDMSVSSAIQCASTGSKKLKISCYRLDASAKALVFAHDSLKADKEVPIVQFPRNGAGWWLGLCCQVVMEAVAEGGHVAPWPSGVGF